MTGFLLYGEGVALAGGFVEEDGGGSGGVKGFDAARHGNADACGGAALDFFREACAFVADEKRDRLAPIDVPGGECGFVDMRRSGEGANFERMKLRKKNWKSRTGKKSQMERGSGGGAKSFRREGAG